MGSLLCCYLYDASIQSEDDEETYENATDIGSEISRKTCGEKVYDNAQLSPRFSSLTDRSSPIPHMM